MHYADWEDIKIVLRYIIVEDPHINKNNRFRAQLVVIHLLIADNGERPGAIVRSESYREEEVALCYWVYCPVPYDLGSGLTSALCS